MRIAVPLFDAVTALDAVGPYEVLRMLPDAEVVFAAATPGIRTDGAGSLGLPPPGCPRASTWPCGWPN
ncbi:hypothetical protein [Kitasatospora sp. NPDC059827]|uniref:hypothetical protein n=1 Tax=Kitasatospora sp. NPDC059827 TaxID=3346964 RepID=UPI0036523BD0